MDVTTLFLNGRRYSLAGDVDVDALKGEFLSVAAGTPRFVEFRTEDDDRISALVTSGLAVHFEVSHEASMEDIGWDALALRPDLLGYLPEH